MKTTISLLEETGVPDLPLALGSPRCGDVPDDITGYDRSSLNMASYQAAGLVIKAQSDAQDVLVPTRMVPLRDLPRHELDTTFCRDQTESRANMKSLKRLPSNKWMDGGATAVQTPVKDIYKGGVG